jgi:hypothetical protein
MHAIDGTGRAGELCDGPACTHGLPLKVCKQPPAWHGSVAVRLTTAGAVAICSQVSLPLSLRRHTHSTHRRCQPNVFCCIMAGAACTTSQPASHLGTWSNLAGGLEVEAGSHHCDGGGGQGERGSVSDTAPLCTHRRATATLTAVVGRPARCEPGRGEARGARYAAALPLQAGAVGAGDVAAQAGRRLCVRQAVLCAGTTPQTPQETQQHSTATCISTDL